MLQAKTSLSKLVETIEQGREQEIIIARNGRPVARLTGLQEPQAGRRIGVAKGRSEVPESIDEDNEEVVRLLLGGSE